MPGLGYALEHERRDLIRAESWPFPSMEGLYTAREIDPRPWWRIRNQGNQGSCRGHSLAASAKYCATLAAGMLDLDEDGQVNEAMDDDFSAQWCYIITQQHDGIRGDRGSTISGGIKTGKGGIAREITWPYPGRYSTRIPDAAREDARRFRLKRVTEIRDEQQAWEWMQSGQGCIDWGKVWPLPFEGSPRSVVRGLSRRASGGGHATAIIGCVTGQTLKRDVSINVKDDEWFYVAANSHGTRAQDRGFYYVSREGFAEALDHSYTAAIGWSDLEGVQPRVVDWDKAWRNV